MAVNRGRLTLPPLLKLLQECKQTDLYNLAAKNHLITGVLECTRRTVSNAAWSDDQTTLTLHYGRDARTILKSDGADIVATCDCRYWTAGRHCPHVVMSWAVLKRLVSPDCLAHIRFNPQFLDDMARLTGLKGDSDDDVHDAIASPGKSDCQKEIGSPQLKPKQTAEPIRLVLSIKDGELAGSLQRGSETISPWSTYAVPVEIARFMASAFIYYSSPRYFETFLKITNGEYPIVHADGSGREIQLTYRADAPRRACVTFGISDEEVLITRTLDGSAPIAAGSLVHGSLLFDLDRGTIHPLAGREAWKMLEEILEQLLVADNSGSPVCFDRNREEFSRDNGYYNPQPDAGKQDFENRVLRQVPHGVAVTAARFNAASLILEPSRMIGFYETFFFLHNGTAADMSQREKPDYILDIPAGITQKTVALVPLGMNEECSFPFSHSTFWFLDPANRSRLSVPMKTRKRVRAVVEAGFALLEGTKSTTRNAVIRTSLATPDFLKRNVKREAKRILTTFAEQCDRKALLIKTAQSGWRFIEDDRLLQARLLKITFEVLGAELFSVGLPGALELPADVLVAKLPNLASRLRQAGFGLRLANESLATTTWEFCLDATTSTLDWFELRPEIRCDGELLKNEELRALFEGNRILRRDGRLVLVDELSAQVLAMFAGAMPADRRKRKGESEPVRVPRLQILDWLQLRGYGVTVKLTSEDARVLESLLNFECIPERPLPGGLHATLRHYQVDAWRWLSFLYDHRLGACLADDMGLGKTIQGISLLAGLLSGEIASSVPAGTPHLIVVPPSLMFNWEAEIARFLPGAGVLLYTGAGRSVETFAGHDIIITSYGIVQRDIDQLEKLRFDVVIFDETQVVKNLKAATTNAVRRLKGAFVLALTGTPLENHIGEYFAIMDLCLPGLLGKREEFVRQINKAGPGGVERLIARTRPFVLRRSKQMIAGELPPKIETDIHLELSTKQRVLYQRTVEEVRGKVREAFENHNPGQARIIALTAILRLRQICLAPALAAPGASDASPKLEFLAEQLLELRDEGHSALVFSQFTSYLDILQQGLNRQGITCLRLDGMTPVPQRKNLVNSFQNAVQPAVFLISLKAGGKGLNLTRATYVYHMDPWWNPAVENQASDRAHRIGQTSQVTITRLIMRHTIEEKMMALKERKLKLYRAILEEQEGGGGASLSREDFEFLLG